ncbi:hypothetical protein OAP63_05735 [Vibrio sp.]|nr:hypothetical protein [Vibrio sp.]
MKNNVKLLGLISIIAFTLTGCNSEDKSEPNKQAVQETQPAWLNSVYINQDTNAMMKEVVFCEDGKVAIDGTRRDYTVENKDGHKQITVNANGAFHFSVSADETQLLPTDDFTKEWFTKSALQQDKSNTTTCEW